MKRGTSAEHTNCLDCGVFSAALPRRQIESAAEAGDLQTVARCRNHSARFRFCKKPEARYET